MHTQAADTAAAQLPAVTLVIVNWNGRHHLQQYLPSVVATDYPIAALRILVFDNGSTDDSCDFLAAHYPQVTVVRHPTNEGFAQGNNLAMAHVQTPYAVLLNSDVEVTPGWLLPLVQMAEANARVAAVQPKIRALRQPTHFEYAGAAGGWIDYMGIPFCRGRMFDTLELDTGQYDTPQQVFWTSGACMLVRMSAIAELGYLFDATYFAHMEEIDFCWRAQNAGWQLWVAPQAVVYHLGGGTLPQHHPHKTYLNVRNSLLTLVKNLPAAHAWGAVLCRLPLDGLAALHALLTAGNWRMVGAVLRAHFAFYARIPYALRMRRRQQQRPLRSLSGSYSHSLLGQYFLRKKRHFAQLGANPSPK